MLVCRKAEGLALQPLPRTLGRRAGWSARCPAAAQALNSHVHVSCVSRSVFAARPHVLATVCTQISRGRRVVNERALKISGDVLDVVKCEDATDVFRVCVLDEDPVARSRHHSRPPGERRRLRKLHIVRVVISRARLCVCSGVPLLLARLAVVGVAAAFCAGDHGRAAARLTRVQQLSDITPFPRAANSHG